MKKSFLAAILCVLACFSLKAQDMAKRSQYINQFRDIAISEMKRTGIPASITLAQGILESGTGTSRLATQANNHFGIKCHDWTGPSIKHDDDAKGECFRVYRNAEESYRDHSEFLLNRPRYAELFKLSSTDYINWAHGLKKAGYATNPMYAQLLIKIIEESELYMYDDPAYKGDLREKGRIGAKREVSKKVSKKPEINEIHGYQVYENNGRKLVIAKAGDTFRSLGYTLGVPVNSLASYNDLNKDYQIYEGQWIYIQKKRSKAVRGTEIHKVEIGETYYDIAQFYGIRLKSLYKMNGIPFDATEPEPGAELIVR